VTQTRKKYISLGLFCGFEIAIFLPSFFCVFSFLQKGKVYLPIMFTESIPG
jgi:hypothetical protein